MSAPTVRNLSVYEGDDYSLRVTVTDAAGVAVDVTGYTYLAEVRDGDGVLVETATVELTTPASGIITVRLSDTQTAALAAAGSRLLWDLRQTDGSSLRRTLLRGVVNVTPDI